MWKEASFGCAIHVNTLGKCSSRGSVGLLPDCPVFLFLVDLRSEQN